MGIRHRISEPANVSKIELPVAIIEGYAPGIVFDDLVNMGPRAKLRLALDAIPLNEVMPTSIWHNDWTIPYLKQRFQLRHVKVALYPIGVRALLDDNKTRCIGCQVSMLNPHPRTGQKHLYKLQPEYKKVWFHLVNNWLEEIGL